MADKLYRNDYASRADYNAALAAQKQGVDYSKVNPTLAPEQISEATHSWGGGFLSTPQLTEYLSSAKPVSNKVTDLNLPSVDNGGGTYNPADWGGLTLEQKNKAVGQLKLSYNRSTGKWTQVGDNSGLTFNPLTGGVMGPGTTGAAGDYVTGGGTTTTGGTSTGGTTTGGGTVGDIDTDILGQQEADINASIAAAQKSREERVVSEMNIQRQLVDQMFAPQYASLDKELEKTLQSVQFAGAAPGSLWGDRQMAAVEGVHATAANARRAVDAEKEATMRLYEAAIKGETDEVINSLKQDLMNVQGERQQAADAMKLALAGADEASIKAASELAKFNREAIQKFYEDQGMTFNPVTGETALNEQYQAEVQKMLSDKALTDVKAAEALDAMMNPKLDVQYFTDETGMVSAVWSNPKTGEQEVVQIGDIGAAKSVSGDGSFGAGELGFNPNMSAIYEDLQATMDEYGATSEEFSAKLKTYQRKGYDTVALRTEQYNYFTTPASMGGGAADSTTTPGWISGIPGQDQAPTQPAWTQPGQPSWSPGTNNNPYQGLWPQPQQ